MQIKYRNTSENEVFYEQEYLILSSAPKFSEIDIMK